MMQEVKAASDAAASHVLESLLRSAEPEALLRFLGAFAHGSEFIKLATTSAQLLRNACCLEG